MTEITLFKFDDTEISTIAGRDGEPWFKALDVCSALKITNPTVAVKALDDDERSKFNLGRQGEVNFISESGLYTLTLRCRDAMKPGTKPHRFRKWVTSDVIPSIRKAGSYSAPTVTPLTETQIVAQALQITTRQIETLKAEVSLLKPQAEVSKIIAQAVGDLGVRDAGRELEIGQNRVVEFVLRHKWACKEGGKLKAAHYGLEKKYCRMCASTYQDRITGEMRVREDFRLTRTGIDRIAYHLARQRIANQETAVAPSREMELH